MRPFAPALLALAILAPCAPLAAQDAAPERDPPAIRWPHVLAAVGAVAAATTFDAPIAQRIGPDPSPAMQRAARTFNRFGEVGVIAPVVGGMIGVGLLTDRPQLVETGTRTALAIGVATVLVSAKKYPLGRERPYEDPALAGGSLRPMSGSTALPSGHTAAAFAFATSLADAVDHPLADVAFYGLAGGTAFARLADRKHWFSDVVAGAIVGTVSAKLAHGNLSLFGLKAPRIGVGRNGAAVEWRVEMPAVR